MRRKRNPKDWVDTDAVLFAVKHPLLGDRAILIKEFDLRGQWIGILNNFGSIMIRWIVERKTDPDIKLGRVAKPQFFLSNWLKGLLFDLFKI